MFSIDNIAVSINTIIKETNALSEENKKLHAENVKLKSEHYKDEELIRLSNEKEEMAKELKRGFGLTESEEQRLSDWLGIHTLIHGNESEYYRDGRLYDYVFTPTPLGVFGEVKCKECEESFVFKEPENSFD